MWKIVFILTFCLSGYCWHFKPKGNPPALEILLGKSKDKCKRGTYETYTECEKQMLREAVFEGKLWQIEHIVTGRKEINPGIGQVCGMTVLHMAAMYNKSDIIRFYIDRLQNVNPALDELICDQKTPLHIGQLSRSYFG